MVFSTVFERFVAACPACVMFRAVMEHVFAPPEIDALFHQVAVQQYERELLFSTVVDLVSQIVMTDLADRCMPRMSRIADSRFRCLSKPCTTSSVTSKPGTSRALVQHTAREAWRIGRSLQGHSKAAVEGLPRANPRRQSPGQDPPSPESLARYGGWCLARPDPGAAGSGEDDDRRRACPCEDGHAQERSLLDRVVARVSHRGTC